ncbi:MAG: DNA-directed RNA polymerase subunit beta' [Candidatus Fermentibacteraceae bacterium]|nr:DNA-directed RNA polymerase subunit beta' [Candidatus Fermentibacteraceae bacterium]
MLDSHSLRDANTFPADFSGIRISLASPETIKEWSYGEVTKAETINYRSYKPEPDGLFCEKIFGPVKDWECSCGRYKKPRYRGVKCDRCGVEVTHSRVRRSRMGHIELAVPVSHIWYFKSRKINKLLDITNLNLERVLYYESYIVITSEHPSLKPGKVLDDEDYYAARETYGEDAFTVGMGAEAVTSLLSEIDLDELAATLRTSIANETTQSRRQKNLKRLKEVVAFEQSKSDNKPEWMILRVLPVLPPDLRPLVPLEGGRFASSDLNDLYRRVINRNNRLLRLLDLQAPDVILRNEKRMLQEAVDAVLDNGSRRKPVKGAGMRPLRSLSDLLKGKRGRFRQNLLGKRVDYSGRSVIVVGPELKMHQCGLPKTMALELFKPFVVGRLARLTGDKVKMAQKQVEDKDEIVWAILEEVIANHPVLLNRAPTLHRLGIQAFEPVLVEGLAIRLHPLACAAFNADFDGDQMAVHLPLSAEAQIEARVLMLGSRNILQPSSGEPVASPSHDIVIGAYYITKPLAGDKGEGMIFASREEVIGALDAGKVNLHSRIKIRGINNIKETNSKGERRQPKYWKDYTIPGQVIFNSIVPEGMGYIMANGLTDSHAKVFGKKGLNRMVSRCFTELGAVKTAVFLDNLKDLGFKYSTTCGLTVGMDDMIIPDAKKEIISESTSRVAQIEFASRKGEMTESDRYNKVIDVWSKATEDVKNSMMEQLSHDNHGFNPIYLMANSGARGSVEQVRQLAGMRGLMAKPKKKLVGEIGETIETPIISSLKEGLSVIEYSISTHGSRKGLADTALKTADAGYLTRRLVDVCQDVVITTEDCGTIRGREVTSLKEGEKVIEKLSERIVGRVTAEDVYDPVTDEIICEAGAEITPKLASYIDSRSIESVKIRSVLTCEAERGLCAKCYGWDLSRNRMVTEGEAVGVIAAQSIGEPGTQLTLRTFHTGGVASREAQDNQVKARHPGKVSFRNIHLVGGTDAEGKPSVIASRNGQIDVVDADGEILSSYEISPGSIMFVKDDQVVEREELLFVAEPFSNPIVSEHSGSVHYVDIEEDVTLQEDIDTEQHRQMIIVEDRSRTLHPHIFVLPEFMVVLSGRPRRREEELITFNELVEEAETSNGRIVFTYRDTNAVRPTSLYDDIVASHGESTSETPMLSIDCRKVATGSYAAFSEIVQQLGGATAKSKKDKKEFAVLKDVTDRLAASSSRKNDELEDEFMEALSDYSRNHPFVMGLACLDKAHAGTRQVILRFSDVVADARILVLVSFFQKGGFRSHIVVRGKQKQMGQDQVEQFIKDHVRGIYPIPSGATLHVRDGHLIKTGTHIARMVKRAGMQKDITGGLPRVDELFEARRPGDAAAIAEISGTVTLSPIKAAMRTVTITGDQGQEANIKIQATKHIRVREGDRVEAGDKLTDGPLDPHDILRVIGTESVEDYLLNEIQEVYRLQGVKINDKHIGIVVRQMLGKARVENAGDTQFLEGARVGRLNLNKVNTEMMSQGRRPASSDVMLLGITKASLATNSFLSAASFQETNSVLSDAAINGKLDKLVGLKENVIVGHLVPAGTGAKVYRELTISMSDGSDLPKPAPEPELDDKFNHV